MTVYAQRCISNPDHLGIHLSFGSLHASCEEDIGHLRSFYVQLGGLLDIMDAEREARRKLREEAENADRGSD